MFVRALKFDRLKLAQEILDADIPQTCKRLGKRAFHGQQVNMDIWCRWKDEVMKETLILKFTTDPTHIKLYNTLVVSSPALLVEASATDIYWGIGLDKNDPVCEDSGQWRGKNQLGTHLMELRAFLIAVRNCNIKNFDDKLDYLTTYRRIHNLEKEDRIC